MRGIMCPLRRPCVSVIAVFILSITPASAEETSTGSADSQTTQSPIERIAVLEQRVFGWDPLESTCRHASLSIL